MVGQLRPVNWGFFCYLVLPHYPEHSAVSQEVEDLEFLFLAVVCHPGFVTIEKIAYNAGLEDICLCGNDEVFIFSEPLG